MIHPIIEQKKARWVQSEGCTIRELVGYMRERACLRDTQVDAIETYLFLKIAGENKPLWQLFAEGFLFDNTDLSQLNINQTARDFLSQNTAARALFEFARSKNGNGSLAPGLEQKIKDDPAALDYESVIKSIFYNVNYADYLMSLPMGAGKTYLMAAFIYLDLYFAHNEPDNPLFAHNFLVLIPSGLKSSIVPSLKTIENFDPSWVLPEPAAGNLKRMLQFEVLDEQKTAKKSNKARNPNAQKVNACLPNPFGRVFVVNAEKVILESFQFNAQTELVLEKEEGNDTHNDLKRLFGRIPNLSLFIDEVHHAQTDDIKLRQAVNYWHQKGNITSVIGFSGTPYLQKADKIKAGDYEFRFSQITNTVYYFPLITAVRKFLKTPTVRVARNLDRLQIIREGIADFDRQYRDKSYANGSIPKLAIYCGTIEVLEQEVYPFLIGELKINPAEILRFHRGNKQYPQPADSELEFRSLDLPLSKKRYVLLVQIGKEGWDCPSLTGVILSQKGDSPKNMVLQTACRCLRQVDRDADESAVIWLNPDNAETLNKQLRQEQNTSIEELNETKRGQASELVDRHSRMGFLQLPQVDFYQMKVTYQAIDVADDPDTRRKLQALLQALPSLKQSAMISSSAIDEIQTGEIETVYQRGTRPACYSQWLFEISRDSFGLISEPDLRAFDVELRELYATITFERKGVCFFNDLYDHYALQSRIRLAFSIRRRLQTHSEVIPRQAELLITEKLTPAVKNNGLYPDADAVDKILHLDNSGDYQAFDNSQIEQAYALMKTAMEHQGLGAMVPKFEAFRSQHDYPLPVRSKDHSFHYLPYNFGASGSSRLEQETLQKTLQLADFKNKSLEIYYNGERELTGFVIDCFAKEGNYWKNIGKYTTDFLVVQRKEKQQLHKILLIETKGAIYAKDPAFIKRKQFIETRFLELNKEKFGYQRFDFLYLEDSKDMDANVNRLNAKINAFFAPCP